MTAESYRDHAAECLQLSTKMTDPHSRSVLRAMAIAWADLAEQAERKEAAEQPPLHRSDPPTSTVSPAIEQGWP